MRECAPEEMAIIGEWARARGLVVAPSRLAYTASITASATFGHPAWWTGSPNPHFFRGLGVSTWDVVCWGGRRHDQGRNSNIHSRIELNYGLETSHSLGPMV